ncbi:TIGR03013 family XrtA/PEP-CTERM system glycosyltransferase [Nitrosococcus wardiae]|uniref:TIGR03013 family PEP-CTERM/XrtA system glycosyltransferase n=1 Tax=Nitrosococcus wardiae TaxID=1814290 RepID=A0A4V1AVV5_9GAMM|nr:TIGR03013 family XrtA/PEP-CTERM system glycosyltransferase [Nitrosococcus wardiae]QBQ54455.1 TIGR03013 family PEP-CTERM/XrtA system glycosyltransferase [Nitrosococcus wardiae]
MGTIRFFSHYIKRAFLILAFCEAVILLSSVWLAAFIRFTGDRQLIQEDLGLLWPKAMVYAIVVVMALIAAGLYRHHQRYGLFGIFNRLVVAMVVAGPVMAVIFYLVPELYFGRGILVLSIIISFLALLLSRSFFLYLMGLQGLQRRLLIFGAGKWATSVSTLRRRSDRLGIDIVGYVPLPGEAIQIPEDQLVEVDVSLQEYVEREGVDEIVIAADERRGRLPSDELLNCRMAGVEVTDLLDFFEQTTGKLKIDVMYPSWLLFSVGFRRHFLRQVGKRVFDVTVSLVLLIFCSPLMLFAVFAILSESGRPVLYRQRRVGAKGKPFDIFKFRTMRQDAEADGKARWAASGDPRITGVGRWLRRTRIDELPQIFNILQGDMSFVGPRPERPEFVETLAEKIPYYGERHRVKPGLTGWAQICYPYGSTERDAFEKLQYDLYYIKNYSLFLDLMILLQTVEVVVLGKGAR